MKFMRSKYAHVQHETFEYSVLREEDNETDSEDDVEGEEDRRTRTRDSNPISAGEANKPD